MTATFLTQISSLSRIRLAKKLADADLINLCEIEPIMVHTINLCPEIILSRYSSLYQTLVSYSPIYPRFRYIFQHPVVFILIRTYFKESIWNCGPIFNNIQDAYDEFFQRLYNGSAPRDINDVSMNYQILPSPEQAEELISLYTTRLEFNGTISLYMVPLNRKINLDRTHLVLRIGNSPESHYIGTLPISGLLWTGYVLIAYRDGQVKVRLLENKSQFNLIYSKCLTRYKYLRQQKLNCLNLGRIWNLDDLMIIHSIRGFL